MPGGATCGVRLVTLRPFMRMNGRAPEVEQFVSAVSGQGLSVRDIELLARGFFRGPESFRQEILQGNVALPLARMREVPAGPAGCDEFEGTMLRDLAVTQKYMLRVMGKSEDARLASGPFHAQSQLLTAGILSRGPGFLDSVSPDISCSTRHRPYTVCSDQVYRFNRFGYPG